MKENVDEDNYEVAIRERLYRDTKHLEKTYDKKYNEKEVKCEGKYVEWR